MFSGDQPELASLVRHFEVVRGAAGEMPHGAGASGFESSIRA
jgi:hypothetical protein